MNLSKETFFLLDKYGIKASKSLGQNFLVSETAINSIVDCSDLSKEDLVIEIGPGLGTLTAELLKVAGFVTCIELDRRMCTILDDRFKLYTNFELINKDVLKVDLHELIKEKLEKHNLKRVKVVANLPYYITTPIIMKLLEDNLGLTSITVMIQKEVAQRLIAEPGTKDSGAITYAIHYYTNPKMVLNVPNSSFIPAPKVDSSVIKLEVLDKPKVQVKDEKLFFKIIKASFMQKRKTFKHGLTSGGICSSKEEVEEMLDNLGLDKNIRGETFTLEDFANIANYLSK